MGNNSSENSSFELQHKWKIKAADPVILTGLRAQEADSIEIYLLTVGFNIIQPL